MTLRDFFALLAEHPFWLLVFFLALPATALLAGWIAKGVELEAPWRYVYSALVYLACVPGVFAVALSFWVFVFERRSIYDTDIYTQVLPILSMVLTLLIIRRSIDLDRIPGFDKITGLMMMVAAIIAFLWVLDRTHIIVFSYLPFWQGILVFIGLLVVVRWGWSRVARKSAP